MRLLGIDPGRTTGICVINDNDGLTVEHVREITWDDRFSISPLLSWFADNGNLPQPLVIVVESFHLYQHRAKQQIGSDFPSVQVIGIVEATAHRLQLLDAIVYQPASNISRTQVLPQHMSIVGGSEHMKDAYKHARYYWETNVNHSKASSVSVGGSRAGRLQ